MALKKATIVLEGGATRGIFTSGALWNRIFIFQM